MHPLPVQSFRVQSSPRGPHSTSLDGMSNRPRFTAFGAVKEPTPLLAALCARHAKGLWELSRVELCDALREAERQLELSRKERWGSELSLMRRIFRLMPPELAEKRACWKENIQTWEQRAYYAPPCLGEEYTNVADRVLEANKS